MRARIRSGCGFKERVFRGEDRTEITVERAAVHRRDQPRRACLAGTRRSNGPAATASRASHGVSRADASVGSCCRGRRAAGGSAGCAALRGPRRSRSHDSSRGAAGRVPGNRAALELAERLGACVVRITARDAAAGFSAFAQREGITHAVFGPGAERGPAWRRSTLEAFSLEQKGTVAAVLRPRATTEDDVERAEEWVATIDSPSRMPGLSRWAPSLVILGSLVSLGAFFVLPAAAGAALAIAGAGAWCAWLERHPEA